MRRVRIMKVPMQYGGGNAYIPYVSEAPVTPEERMKWNQVAGQMRQQPGTGVRNWDHNQDFQNEFLQSKGFTPNRVQAIQADMQQRNQSMPGTVTYGPQGMSKADNWLGSQTKDQRYVHYQYQHLDPHGNQYPGEAGFVDRGTEPMTKDEMNNWANSRPAPKPNSWITNDRGIGMDAPQSEVDKLYQKAGSPSASNFPTRQQSIDKYKARNGAPLPSNYFAGESSPSDYSIDAVRAGYAKFGGMMAGGKKKVRISSVPGNQVMSMGGETYVPGGAGGYGNQQPGHGYALDLQRMQQGGNTKQNPTIYTNNINDPRLQSYNDSLNMYNAFLMQQKLMGKGKKIMENGPGTWSMEEAKDRRTPKTVKGFDRPIAEDFQSEKEQFKDGFGFTARKEDKKLIDYYKSLHFNSPTDIEYHSSPDLVHSKIKPIATYFDGSAQSPMYKKPVQPIQLGLSLQKMPYSWEHLDEGFHPQQVQVPNLPPVRTPNSGWYSNNQLVPIDASDEDVDSKLYNPDGTRKFQMGGNSSNFEVGKHYDLHPSHVQELMNQGYDITIL